MYSILVDRTKRNKKGRPLGLEVFIGQITCECNAKALLSLIEKYNNGIPKHPIDTVVALSQGLTQEMLSLFQKEGIGQILVTLKDSHIPEITPNMIVVGNRCFAFEIALLGLLLAGHADEWLLTALTLEKKRRVSLEERIPPTSELRLLLANLDSCRRRFERTTDYSEFQATIGYSIQTFLAQVGKGPRPPVVKRTR